jgi:hypothetical protein
MYLGQGMCIQLEAEPLGRIIKNELQQNVINGHTR